MQNKKAVPNNYVPTEQDIENYNLARDYLWNGSDEGFCSLLGSILHLVDFPVKGNPSLARYACSLGRRTCISVILQAGASLDPEWTKNNSTIQHPLYFVVNDSRLLIELLEKKRLDPNHVLAHSNSRSESFSILDMALLYCEDYSVASKSAAILRTYGAHLRYQSSNKANLCYVRIIKAIYACRDASFTVCCLMRSDSPILNNNCKEPIKIIAKMVWQSRVNEEDWPDDVYERGQEDKSF